VPDLVIALTKRPDGDVVLRCTRADGSATWQRHRGGRAAFFPLHDLTHYTVERELGVRRGFFGLIAQGWDIGDTDGKSPRGPLPPDAIAVEDLVGAMDLQRASGTRWSAADLNEHLAARAAREGRPAPRPLTDEDLARLRARWHDLLEQWTELPGGGTLELVLDRSISTHAAA
jgi:hypothetical protein